MFLYHLLQSFFDAVRFSAYLNFSSQFLIFLGDNFVSVVLSLVTSLVAVIVAIVLRFEPQETKWVQYGKSIHQRIHDREFSAWRLIGPVVFIASCLLFWSQDYVLGAPLFFVLIIGSISWLCREAYRRSFLYYRKLVCRYKAQSSLVDMKAKLLDWNELLVETYTNVIAERDDMKSFITDVDKIFQKGGLDLVRDYLELFLSHLKMRNLHDLVIFSDLLTASLKWHQWSYDFDDDEGYVLRIHTFLSSVDLKGLEYEFVDCHKKYFDCSDASSKSYQILFARFVYNLLKHYENNALWEAFERQCSEWCILSGELQSEKGSGFGVNRPRHFFLKKFVSWYIQKQAHICSGMNLDAVLEALFPDANYNVLLWLFRVGHRIQESGFSEERVEHFLSDFDGFPVTPAARVVSVGAGEYSTTNVASADNESIQIAACYFRTWIDIDQSQVCKSNFTMFHAALEEYNPDPMSVQLEWLKLFAQFVVKGVG